MNPLWYLLYLGLIGAGFAAAHVIGVRESRTQRLKTQDARDKIHRVFDGGACQSYERLEAIARRFADGLVAHDGTHQFTMAQLDRAISDANRNYSHFADAVADPGAGDGQLLGALCDFCRKYSELVLLLGDVAQQSGHSIAPDERFEAWVRDDQAFSRELMRLARAPEYSQFSRVVRGFFGQDGFMASLSLRTVVLGDASAALLDTPQPDTTTEIQLRPSDRLATYRRSPVDRVH